MFSIDTLSKFAIKAASIAGLYAKKHSPEILIGTGLVSSVGALSLAISRSSKGKEVLEECKQEYRFIKEAKEKAENNEIPGDIYTVEDYKKDFARVSFQSAIKITKVYTPVILLEAFSIASVLAGLRILKGRNIALAAAYAGVKKIAETRKRLLTDYREEVQSKVGPEVESDLWEKSVAKQELPKEGTKINSKHHRLVAPSNYYADENSRIFCEENTWMWKKNAEQNLMLLRSIQAHANDMLIAKGHVFLNEVYDLLGFDRSAEGAVIGWVENGTGDNYIDFGFLDMSNPQTRKFIDGEVYDVLLNFNVDGVIYDLI